MKHGESMPALLRLHRYPTTLLGVTVLILLSTVLIIFPSLWSEGKSWGIIFNAPSDVEISAIQSELAFFDQQNVLLRERIARLAAERRLRATDQQQLSFISHLADSLGLEMQRIDSDPAKNHTQNKSSVLTLRAEGLYHDFGYFVSRLESSRYEFVISQLVLVRLNPGNSRLSGVVVLVSHEGGI